MDLKYHSLSIESLQKKEHLFIGSAVKNKNNSITIILEIIFLNSKGLENGMKPSIIRSS